MSIKTIPAFHSWFYRTGHLNFFHKYQNIKLLRAHNKITPHHQMNPQSSQKFEI